MKAMSPSSSPPPSSASTFIKIPPFALLSSALFLLFRLFTLHPTTALNHHHHSTDITAPPPPSPPPPATVELMGIVNELGIMTDDFVVGELDKSLANKVVADFNSSRVKGKDEKVVNKVEKFRICDGICSDNVGSITRFRNSSDERRSCPEKKNILDCLLPWPKGYKLHIPWPQSRDEVWLDNIPHMHFVETDGGQDWISRNDGKIILSGHEPPFTNGVEEYLDHISKMSPGIEFGRHTCVVLDIGSGIGSLGAYLMDRNVMTLSIDSKDVDENRIQIALERGVPAMLCAFGKRRFPYPSQAFDLIHCARCEDKWAGDGGVFLLEANRMLRAGGFFVWASRSINKDEDAAKLVEQRRDMESLASKLCWEAVNNEGYITIWQKPLNNSCYRNREPDAQPSLCAYDDDPDDIWNVDSSRCITRLPENGYGANMVAWPARLHSPPARLFTIPMDAYRSRKALYKADSIYWNDIVKGYINAFHMRDMNIRNAMDMKAGYGGFAAALVDFQMESWVMNVVPVSGPNTLPVIYDRGLVGVMHDWCEPFGTYPRTYDLLNAAGLFSVEHKRCNITSIMVEMDRILRPGGRVYIRDMTSIIDNLQEIAKALGWVTFMFDSGEGPHSNWKLLTGEKRL